MRRSFPTASWSRPRRSTTCARPRTTGGMRSASSPRGRSRGASAREDLADGQRRASRGGRLGRRQPPHVPPRHTRAAGLEERLRAGRVRLVLCPLRRNARLLVPRARGAGGGARDRHGRGARARGRAASGATGVRRSGRRPVRLLHARARRGRRRPPRPRPAPLRRRDPRVALGEPVPLHGVREDLRRRPDRRGADVSVATERRLTVGRIGERLLRDDAVPKVTGEFAYASDLSAPGMLWGDTLRSPHAHARIVSIDLSAGLRLDGVHAVLTHADVPGAKLYGLEFADQPVLAIDRVRYVGEPVVVVAAEHPEQARRALEAIVVEYEPLEPVVDMERALEQEPLHPDRPTMGHGYRDDPRPNVVRHIVIRHGDPDMSGDVVVTGTYEVGTQDQAFLGPESGLAVPDGEGGIDIHVATQWLHVDRDQVAPCLGLPPDQVRIHLAGVGGAFGGREDLSMQIHGALLALHTSRPVKIVYNREESFTGHVHRHPARIRCEHRATADGRLTCVRMAILLDGGAYASSSTAVASNAASFALGPYRVDNALIEATAVYSNNPPCGAMRGFGAVQTCFAAEAQMDLLAAELGIDAVELRLLNALEPGDILPTGQIVTGSLPTREVIRRAAAIPLPPDEPLPRDPLRLPGGAGNTTTGEGVRRGVGFALGFKNICYSEGFDDFCTARVQLAADGSAVVHSAAAEVGPRVT